jgi:hypothetical protein
MVIGLAKTYFYIKYPKVPTNYHAKVFGTYNWLLSDLEILPADLIKSATHQLKTRFIQDEKKFAES